ncbi:tripartite tricarboxylate transporter substrate binding protein [Pantoea sp. 18069]|uniref:Bug family tripartite tricarboxylate transporter substrate binding protein n=1 Tax=Pantoea sp. 18069 TaxID=2681415 RepID=UPI001358B19C|nr:tripartite tricarboxylate transporter substrate-binding protein [Pantoea sp. 18069]
MKIFKYFRFSACTLLLATASQYAAANASAPVRLLVGFVPGGTSDTVARLLAEELRGELGRNVIVENKPGAGGRIAAEMLKSSKPDGTTYMFAPDNWAIFPTLLLPETTLRYNYLKDMAPVAKVISYPLGFYGSQMSGAKDLKEFVELAKKNKDLTLYASAGTGSITEFLGILMREKFGVKMTVVPYKGGGEVKTALLGNQVAAGIMAPSEILQFTKERKITAFGFMTKERWSVAPNIPTLKEQGFDVTQGEAFMGVWASSKTEASEREKMEKAIKNIVAKDSFRQKVLKTSVYPEFSGSQDLDREVKNLLNF